MGDDEEVSIAKMLKNISKDIKEEKTEKKFVEFQENVRNQIKENNEALHESISKSVIESLKPKISAMQAHIVETDLKRIVEEQLQQRSVGAASGISTAKPESPAGDEEADEVDESNKESEGDDTPKPQPEK